MLKSWMATLAAACVFAQAAPVLAEPVLYPDGSVRYSVVSTRMPNVGVQSGDVCDIMLQAGERINQVVIADSVRWKVTDGTSRGDTPHVFIKPTMPNIHTTLIITTTRRSYHIRFYSTEGDGRQMIGFYYPSAQHRRNTNMRLPVVAAALPQWTCAPPMRGGYHLGFKRNAPFVPVSVCNDGRRTFVNLGHVDGALPVLVTVGDDGVDEIVGNPVWDPAHNEFTIDGTPKQLALLRDSNRGQIRVNISRSGR